MRQPACMSMAFQRCWTSYFIMISTDIFFFIIQIWGWKFTTSCPWISVSGGGGGGCSVYNISIRQSTIWQYINPNCTGGGGLNPNCTGGLGAPPPPPRQSLPRTQNRRAFRRAASWLQVLRIFWHQVCENRTSRYGITWPFCDHPPKKLFIYFTLCAKQMAK